MTTWTDPKTWSTGELVSALDMNTYIRDNLLFLRDAGGLYTVTTDTDYSTTSTSFVDIDTDDLALSVTTTGALLWLGFSFAMTYGASFGSVTSAALDIKMNGTRLGTSLNGLHYHNDVAGQTIFHHVSIILPDLAAGTYTFIPQWRIITRNNGSDDLGLTGSASGGVAQMLYATEVASA